MSDAYISNELIHWTGRKKSSAEAFKTLKAICDEEQLHLTFCPNYIDASNNFTKNTAMVCFTDIPLVHSAEHCDQFGHFGIAFHKKNMIDYGANPVLYTTSKHFSAIKEVSGLLSKMSKLEMDREWQEELTRYHFTEKQTVSLREILEYLQEYSYKGKDNDPKATYYQREWRLAFNSLPFAGGISHLNPGMATIQGGGMRIFKFSPKDIAYLVVPNSFQDKAKLIAKNLNCSVKGFELEVPAP